MNELEEKIFIEKYRPQTFEDLILENKSLILKFLEKPKSVPSFLFYSNKPGTGKTSCAYIIEKHIGCDFLPINSSEERGIDTIRDKIKLFAMSLSSNDGAKRCVFLDEADGLTRQSQDSLRNLMETYSSNVFFIMTCNDINKIIEPLRSRCTLINFERPNKADVVSKILSIVEKEKIQMNCEVEEFIDIYYPDMRSMIVKLNESKIENKPVDITKYNFEAFFNLIKSKEVQKVYDKVYSGDFPIRGYNKWMFQHLFDNYTEYVKTYGATKLAKIALLLADTEKYWNLGANEEVIFTANILQIMEMM